MTYLSATHCNYLILERRNQGFNQGFNQVYNQAINQGAKTDLIRVWITRR